MNSSRVNHTIKRIFDLFFSLVGICVLSPLMMIAAICIKIESKGPVLARQSRVGFAGEEIVIFKFRTQRLPDDGGSIAQSGRQFRVTRVGKWLRATSFDDTPQLFNIFMSDMSLVGPRPYPTKVDAAFRAHRIDEYGRRNQTKPGLTGWAQVNGCRGAPNSLEQLKERTKLDAWYLDNWSVALDLVIILRTMSHILVKEDN